MTDPAQVEAAAVVVLMAVVLLAVVGVAGLLALASVERSEGDSQG